MMGSVRMLGVPTTQSVGGVEDVFAADVAAHEIMDKSTSQLKTMLKAEGLSISGSRQSLIARLLRLGSPSPAPVQPAQHRQGKKTLLERASAIPVTLCSNVNDANTWIQKEVFDKGHTALGFDTEWTSKKWGTSIARKTALIQIASPTAILLLRMCKLPSVPEGLAKLVASSDVILTGVEVRGDLQKLEADYGMPYDGYCDIAIVAERLYGFQSQPGLYKLANFIFDTKLKKEGRGGRVQVSNWNGELSMTQVKYAALDAYLGMQIHEHMEKEEGAFERPEQLLHFVQQVERLIPSGGVPVNYHQRLSLALPLRASLESSVVSTHARKYFCNSETMHTLFGSYGNCVGFMLNRIVSYHLSAKATNAERRLIAQSIVEQLESKVTELGPPNLNEKLCKFLMGLQVGTQRKSDSWPCVPYDEESERGCKLLLEWMLRSLEGFSDDSFIELLRGARVVHDLARVYKPLLGHTRRAKGSSVGDVVDAEAMGGRENESESESERGRKKIKE
jgi:hypothetical protein